MEGPAHKYIMIVFGILFDVNDCQVNPRPNPEISLVFLNSSRFIVESVDRYSSDVPDLTSDVCGF